MTPPSGHFDVVGILKQFGGFSPPWNTGYEILPADALRRDPDPRSGDHCGARPRRTSSPRGHDLLDDRPAADSRIDYGLHDGYELGTVSDAALVTDHSLTLPGLDPARSTSTG